MKKKDFERFFVNKDNNKSGNKDTNTKSTITNNTTPKKNFTQTRSKSSGGKKASSGK